MSRCEGGKKRPRKMLAMENDAESPVSYLRRRVEPPCRCTRGLSDMERRGGVGGEGLKKRSCHSVKAGTVYFSVLRGALQGFQAIGGEGPSREGSRKGEKKRDVLYGRERNNPF